MDGSGHNDASVVRKEVKYINKKKGLMKEFGKGEEDKEK